MSENHDDMLAQALAEAEKVASIHDCNLRRNHYVGKNGLISNLLRELAQLPAERRKETGARLNHIKRAIEEAFGSAQRRLEDAQEALALAQDKIDVTLPAAPHPIGRLHPVTKVMAEIINIFEGMGFAIAQGPEIEDDFHNFTSLNIPFDHPAREMHDTFYLEAKDKEGKNLLLRTHTSPVQMRAMRSYGAPLAILAPGRTYRRDSDATHTPMFHQIEGLVVDKDITMAHLQGCLNEFIRRFFNMEDLPVRWRPSFFPFTSPSAEVDIGCHRTAAGMELKGDEWMEILGCGMVHEKVLAHGGLDKNEWQGFAFGLGVERLGMLKYGMADLRAFFEGDMRWLNHYGFLPFALRE